MALEGQYNLDDLYLIRIAKINKRTVDIKLLSFLSKAGKYEVTYEGYEIVAYNREKGLHNDTYNHLENVRTLLSSMKNIADGTVCFSQSVAWNLASYCALSKKSTYTAEEVRQMDPMAILSEINEIIEHPRKAKVLKKTQR